MLESIIAEDIPENSIVCFKYVGSKSDDHVFILFSKWTPEIKSDYIFAHSQPYTSEKGNKEPIFPDAMYGYLKHEEQNIDDLRKIYEESEKGPYKTKIHDHKLICVLE